MILVGTSGYSFDDWRGPFYPHYLKRGDWLNFYARHFPAAEINLTYYRIPSAKAFAGMVRKTPRDYPFFVKTHFETTHERVDPRPAMRALLAATAPLYDSGRLHGFLAQFPMNFRNREKERGYLLRLRDLTPPEIPFFAEFRHDSWDQEALYPFLEAQKIGYCAVDEPRLPGLMPARARVTNGTGYVRFHGRNRATWWGRDASGSAAGTPRHTDRYDYLYREEELQTWVKRIRAMEEASQRTFVFFNNCYSGQAVRGARLMQQLMDLPMAGEEQVTLGFEHGMD